MAFKLNLSGVDDVIKGFGVAAELKVTAEKVAGAVEDQAGRFARTGRFSDSIETTDVQREQAGQRITVHSTDPDAHIIEWGSVNNPPYAPFRKAAAALGLRLRQGRQ